MHNVYDQYKSAIVNRLSKSLTVFAKQRGVALDPDSLLVKTTVNSAVHYAPQDIAVLLSAALVTNYGNRKLNPPYSVPNPDPAIAQFLSQKNLKLEDVLITKSRGRVEVSLRD